MKNKLKNLLQKFNNFGIKYENLFNFINFPLISLMILIVDYSLWGNWILTIIILPGYLLSIYFYYKFIKLKIIQFFKYIKYR